MKKVLGTIVIIGVLYFSYNWYQENHSWTLMVCENKMSNGIECDDTSYEIPDYESSKECLLDGAARFSKEGFECGGGCRKEFGDMNVCKEICNAAGCSK